MSEHLRSTETVPHNTAELERMAAERLSNREQSQEHEPNRHVAVEAAREQLQRVEQTHPAAETTPVAEPAYRGVLTKAANYQHTMASLRHRMKPAERAFSNVIHTPAIETASEVVGKTVLRPSVSLGATTTAVLLAGFIYLYARHYGFLLKGSEIWITIIVGGLLGALIEGVYKLFKRSKRLV